MLFGDILTDDRKDAKFDIFLDHWSRQKPHGLSGCFRLKNEEQFMVGAILSHLEWLDEAVLVVQDSTDRTVEIAHDLAKEYPKIRVCHYPFNIYRPNTPEHFSFPANSALTMTHMTNWALYQCNYSWIAKIEGDVIGLSTFGKIRDKIDVNPQTIKHYGRVGLNVAGRNYNFISKTNPRNAGWDESVFNNDPYWHCIKAGKWESINLGEHRENIENMGWSFYHVQRCKHGRTEPKGETWTSFQPFQVQQALELYNQQRPHPGPDNYCPNILFEEQERMWIWLR